MILFYRRLFYITAVLANLFITNGYAQVKSLAKKSPVPVRNIPAWSVSPFDTKVFIENHGQFNISEVSKDKVFYSATLGDVKLYFTTRGIVYKYEFRKNTKDAFQKPVTQHLTAEWENSNPEVTITSEEKLDYPYNYSNGKGGTIRAAICREIVYHNLYKDIDVEYYFPLNKEGYEYDIVVYPGGDISKVQLKYNEAINPIKDESGDVLFTTPVGEITDHTPTCTYSDGSRINVKYTQNGNEEGFLLNNDYDRTKTIVIDPWTTDPKFTGKYDKAYDLNYDNNGNVYVYGGYNPFQLVKLNSKGQFQWAYPAASIDGVIYGGFAVDPKSGTSYLVEGARAQGARILKVNSAGVLVATSFADTNMNEMWRPMFNTCNDNIVIGAGGTKPGSNIQATIVDTSFTSFKNINVLGASAAGHSVVLATIDQSSSSCYMAMAKSSVIDPANFNNALVKLPLPTLSPTTYNVPDSYKFVELASINYVGPGIGAANGMNGMVASLNWLYLYDGGELKRFNKGTGALIDSVKVSNNPYAWGGLDADLCDNIYTGSAKWISVYNSSLSLIDTINLPDTVYDVKIGANRQVLLACGKGFVRSVNIPFSPLSVASKNATCSCNGTATANLCGGADTANVTYLWSNGKTTQTISGLCGGKYKVTVTLGGCTPVNYFDSVTIIQPTPLVATITSKNNVLCNGGYGNATVTTTGGSKPYTYSWSPVGGINALADSLPAGSYTVTVTDSNKCTATAIVVIAQPAVLTDTATNTFAHCSRNDGTATTNITGGITPYSYSWAPGGQTKATATSLSAGLYIVTVTDANGCTAKATTIIADSGVSYTISGVTGEKCYGQSIGSATITMNGSLSSSFTYLWKPGGQTTATATSLPSATYTASVTDGNGCIVTDTVTIVQPDTLHINMIPGMVSCTGGATGSATASTSGGTSPYTFSWSNGGTDSTITGLTSGFYSVAITDVNGCAASDTITITQPAKGLTINPPITTPVSCNGGNNGSATDSASGGTAPYAYNWQPSGGTSTTADSLSAGNYTLTVTDGHGCSTSTVIVITQPSKALSDTIISTNNKCDGDSNGTAFVIASGGTKPYTYSWSIGGSTKDTITKLPAGTYIVSITDSNKCIGSGSITITQPPHLIIGITTTPTPCNKNNGTATASVSGQPFTYSWKPGTNTSPKDSGLAVGIYTVTVTDTNGCKTDTVATVISSIPPKVTAISFPASCDSTNGTAIAKATGGTGAYTYSWTPSGQTNDTAKRIGPAIYTVTVTDSNGCKGTAITIVGDSGVYGGFTGIKNITCNGLTNGSATAGITSGGSGPFSYSWSPGGQTNATATNLGVGTYTVVITDSHNCTATDTLPITQPAVLTATIPPGNVNNVRCFGDSNGNAFPTVTGGTSPYSFVWSDGEKTDTAKSLAAANYTVMVTDSNFCTTTTTVTITQPLLFTVTTSTTAATCNNNGTATAAGHGGTPTFSYNWGSAGVGPTINQLNPGIYTITATDANGCSATDTAKVPYNGNAVKIDTTFNVKCFGTSTGSAKVGVIGGDTLLYNYTWTPGGQTNATATGLSAGIYTVSVFYLADGCPYTVYDTITQPSKLIASVKDTVKCNSSTAAVQVSASGGVPPYMYSWNGGKTTTTADTNLPGGNYILILTDNNGCPDSVKTNVSVPVLNAKFRPEPDTVLGGEFVYFDDLSVGATSWYWTFDNGNTSDSVNPYQQYITDGKYTVYLYITNAKGCRDSTSEIVYVIENLYVPNVFTPNGDGVNDAFHITAGNMQLYNIVIFNRWGEKVFESNSPNIDWTGTSPAGVNSADGTYYYILRATDYEGKSYNLHGYVQLIRGKK